MKHIHERYQDIAREFAGAPCLKTDCWNEAETEYPIAPLMSGVVCIELDPGRVERAREKHPGIEFSQGSIEALPFADGSFARVFDFSTIDHIEDPGTALDEYRRVLAPGGLLILIVWLTKQTPHSQETAWGGKQFYFSGDQFRADLERRFSIIEERNFPDLGEVDYLHLFICRGNI
jgi:SAM-dependent methyltransferase